MPRYKLKPVEIDAIQWTGVNLADIVTFTGAYEYNRPVNQEPLVFLTKTQKCVVVLGSYILKRFDGALFIFGQQGFESQYELVQ